MTEFKIGDKVRCINNSNCPELSEDIIYTILDVDENYVKLFEIEDDIYFYNRFELVEKGDMTEFKMKELGWYECKEIGDNSECIIDKIEIIFHDKITNKFVGRKNLLLYSFDEKGKCEDAEGNPFITIIRYIESELPKEPREFKFEAYLTESPLEFGNPHFAVDVVLGHSSSSFYTHRLDHGSNSKWEITMKELTD